MPGLLPIDIFSVLLAGGVDTLMKRVDEHPAIRPIDKEKAKRMALVEVLIMGNTGQRGHPAQVALAATQTANISLAEMIIEAKLAAQHIPPSTWTN